MLKANEVHYNLLLDKASEYLIATEWKAHRILL